ncbi:MAG TPA: GGDEF domain-containing protein [Pseudonocardiaceae bacterium]|nr:GGDEF domain-containing protein [Pseudonocardiaceae bacterium]
MEAALHPKGWRLWSLPRGAIAFLLVVEVAAVAVTVLLSVRHPVTRQSLEYFGIVVALGLVAAEAARGVERMRRWFTHTPHVNMSSVWTLSAALLTTPALTALAVAVLYIHLWARSWYPVNGVHPYRVVFNTGVVILSSQAAGILARTVPGFSLSPGRPIALLGYAIVIIGYSLVNSALAAIALLLLGEQRTVRDLLGSWHENSVEYATLCVGMLTAAVLLWRPWLAVLMLPPLHVLHRSVLIRQLEHAATVDEKTGLLNAASWHSLAAAQFERARRLNRTLGLLMVDLDHFAQVNERFGREVGDQVLHAVGDTMRRESRTGDLCGRLGGEEFVLLLADSELDDAVHRADRVCQLVRSLQLADDDVDGVRLSASIGVASYPDAGMELDELLLAADNALFAAKDAGRDRARAVQLGAVDQPATNSAAFHQSGDKTSPEDGLSQY